MTIEDQNLGENETGIAPVEIVRPKRQSVPFIFASPHSGRRYAPEFLRQSKLDLLTLRRSEDSYVDLLVDMVPELGAPLLKAHFPRAYVDVNRSDTELDPMIFSGRIPHNSDTRSNRVMAGFGVIPRLAADGHEIYRRKIKFVEAEERLRTCYHPYHDALKELISSTLDQFGCAVIIDCHSMPSRGAWRQLGKQQRDVDFVLGDRYGASCAPGLLSLTQNLFYEAGYVVTRNAPYAGGFVTQNYGRPAEGVHALQIEINRRLYLDEAKVARNQGFDPLRSVLQQTLGELVQIDPMALQTRQAAE